MESDELAKRMFLMGHLESREKEPVKQADPYVDMSSDEKSSFIKFLVEQVESKDEQIQLVQERLEQIIEQLHKSEKNQNGLQATINTLSKQLQETGLQLKETLSENQRLHLKLEKSMAEGAVAKKNLFGSRSQKGISPKKQADNGREKDRDEFDGTGGSLNSDITSDTLQSETPGTATDQMNSSCSTTITFNRKGWRYRKMNADEKVLHASDLSRLPEGAVVLKRIIRKSFEQVCRVIEHDYEFIKYKTADGRIVTAYLPEQEEVQHIDCIPGTHASCNLLSYLAFNKYQMETPLYREIVRLLNERMHISRMTLTNWLEKGAEYLKALLPVLKETALEKGAVVNCDETWCRVKMEFGYRKKYLWCLVNKHSKIVIFFYDDGSRGRKVLTEFLGDAELGALQSDGYNVYMYLDNELIDIEHLCCLAHARAKFKYAFEQGQDERARCFLEWIGQLYAFEEEYKRERLSFEKIRERRMGSPTADVMNRMSTRLHEMLKDDTSPTGDLMIKALHYLNTYWKQLFAYRHDGRYTIDNSLAERCIRPLTVERKNSLFFGSHTGAETSAIYHTFIETCKMNGISSLEYFKKLFHEILTGRNDYANLLPATIGIK